MRFQKCMLLNPIDSDWKCERFFESVKCELAGIFRTLNKLYKQNHATILSNIRFIH